MTIKIIGLNYLIVSGVVTSKVAAATVSGNVTFLV